MSREKMARRKAAGDDPTAVSKSNATFNGAPAPQPMKDTEQGKGNLMNNPQVGQSMGGGMPQPGAFDPNAARSPYGDPVFDPEALAKTGTVGFAPPSPINQNQVPGQRNNRDSIQSAMRQPPESTMQMMDALYASQQTATRQQKLYGEGVPPSHMPSPMGMIGQSMEMGMNIPGQMPYQMAQQMPAALTPALQVGGGAETTQGLDTGSGGGRNKTKKA